jgi:hypothetical protein
MVVVLIRALLTVAFSLDELCDSSRCWLDLLAEKLAAGAHRFYARVVYTIEIQRENLKILIVEANRLLRFRSTC